MNITHTHTRGSITSRPIDCVMWPNIYRSGALKCIDIQGAVKMAEHRDNCGGFVPSPYGRC